MEIKQIKFPEVDFLPVTCWLLLETHSMFVSTAILFIFYSAVIIYILPFYGHVENYCILRF